MKNIIKDACILFAITLVAGILLGLVYNVTKDPIAQQNEKAKQKAYQEVIADADKFEALDGSYASDKVAETAKAVLSASATDFSKDDVSEVVAGIKNGKIIGFVVQLLHMMVTAEISSSLLDFQQMEHILEHLFLQ